jgi:hypothetical protein
MAHISEFLKRYVGDWLTLLCGPLALPLTAYGVYSSNASYNRLFFMALLVLCLVVSSYRVWHKEFLRTLQAQFPIVQYPGGATEFVLSDGDRVVAEYVAVRDLTITNRDPDKTVNIEMFLQIARGSAHLMFSPENHPMPNWRELAFLRDVPNSTQLMFPLSIPPRTSVGGHAIFLMARSMRYGVVTQEEVDDEWFIYMKELISGEKRRFPVTVVDRHHDFGCQIVYARRS